MRGSFRRRWRASDSLTWSPLEVVDLLSSRHPDPQTARHVGTSHDGGRFQKAIRFGSDAARGGEAVEHWRSREQLAAFRRLATGPWLRHVRHIALAAATVALAALFAFLVACGSEAPVDSGGGIYVAVIQPAPGSAFYGDWEAPIRVLDVTTGREQSFGPAAAYGDVAWAPDGTRLAALALDSTPEDELDLYLRSWSRDGELRHELRIPPSRFVEEIAWSPDSSRIALLGAGIMMFDAELTELGWFPVPPRAGGGISSQGQPPQPWSSDSRYVATVSNNLLLLADRDGTGSSHEFPGGLFRGWVDDRLQLVELDSTGRFERSGTLADGVVAWTDRSPDKGDPLGDPDQQQLNELNSLVDGLRFLGGIVFSADGAATAFVLSAPADQPASRPDPLRPKPLSLVIQYQNEQAVVDLGPVFALPLGGVDFLAFVVVPGWDSVLPANLDAATPLPDMPSPTPRPTPTLGSTEPPVTPRPYPTPVGDKVVPQVAGLPVLPGAVEVDGFTRPANPSTDVEETVQVYATSASGASTISFYETELLAAGFALRSSGGGANGWTASFQRGKDSVSISTRYIPRPDDPHADEYPPYGYLGRKRWNLEFEPGIRYFFVITLQAP